MSIIVKENRIDTSGRLLIGTTDGWGSDAKLHGEVLVNL